MMNSNLANARELAYRLDSVIAHGQAHGDSSLTDLASDIQGDILDSLEYGGLNHSACLQASALVERYE